jgi:hypothetical protein
MNAMIRRAHEDKGTVTVVECVLISDKLPGGDIDPYAWAHDYCHGATRGCCARWQPRRKPRRHVPRATRECWASPTRWGPTSKDMPSTNGQHRVLGQITANGGLP